MLTSFARHYQSGAVLPQELYERMLRADTYGRASDEQRQLFFSAVSLDLHTQKPATLNFDQVLQQDFERYNSTAFVPGDHFWASFTHLNGYSSNYYTYVFDKVIALDFFAQFDPQNPMVERRGCATGRRCWRRGARGPRPSWCATLSAATPTSMPTGAGCSRSSRLRLRLLHPLTEALEELRERGVLVHLDAQVTHAALIERLARAVIDRQLARAQDLEGLLE